MEVEKSKPRISYRRSCVGTYIVTGTRTQFVHRLYGDQKVFFHELRILQEQHKRGIRGITECRK